MRLAFLEAGDLGDLRVVQEVGERVGLEAEALARAVEQPEIKSAVRASNDHALSLGVFGVPTVAVGTELFWGDDHLEHAAALHENY